MALSVLGVNVDSVLVALVLVEGKVGVELLAKRASLL